MRVIAQFGRLDVPYENFVFHITKDNYVVATRDSIASPAEMELGVMAKYSSFEKAERAMEILHEAYAGDCPMCHHATNRETKKPYYEMNTEQVDDSLLFSMKRMGELQILPAKRKFAVWQFPQEDEIE